MPNRSPIVARHKSFAAAKPDGSIVLAALRFPAAVSAAVRIPSPGRSESNKSCVGQPVTRHERMMAAKRTFRAVISADSRNVPSGRVDASSFPSFDNRSAYYISISGACRDALEYWRERGNERHHRPFTQSPIRHNGSEPRSIRGCHRAKVPESRRKTSGSVSTAEVHCHASYSHSSRRAATGERKACLADGHRRSEAPRRSAAISADVPLRARSVRRKQSQIFRNRKGAQDRTNRGTSDRPNGIRSGIRT